MYDNVDDDDDDEEDDDDQMRTLVAMVAICFILSVWLFRIASHKEMISMSQGGTEKMRYQSIT